ncbi:thiol:disulfide interchange protein [Candidatus Methylospira mobilis]|uniref:Thiol:disulfide interchange protein n=1 Tax=Candidatus Methylospira mobilis TaxID=1808979 RepID=A0A5Q0BQV2_9GAMM|nr:thioredoxin family protein [Candidatus Methylospira mobilis]QFY44681.1 thiol:disulfide interchange protein [Candidatus Methylospira mobilis]WNV05783.1 protein-disulfide reductase DsbD family protein [Candidatus Methylospira mobilis]
MFNARLFPLIVAFILSTSGLHAVAASSEAATGQVKAQLIASADAVHPGDEILIGVRQSIIPHWHTYWVNPGDSGLATRIEYDLPPGSAAGEIQWPTPSRISMGSVVNYGYQNEVTLLSTLNIPGDSVAGSAFPVKARVNWLVCKEECIPQQVELQLTLPVVGPGAAIGTGSPLIAQARAGLPVASPWSFRLEKIGDRLSLRISGKAAQWAGLKDIWFYPEQWGRIAHGADQISKVSGDVLELQLKPGDDPLASGGMLAGVLAVTENSGEGAATRGYRVDVVLEAAAVPPDHSAAQSDLPLSSALLLALAGGVILNLMPCVFPILSFKALSLLTHAQQSRAEVRLHGLAYTLGILLSFAILGGLLILLKAGGAQIGWGFQFQSPLFVLAVAYLMFAVGLSLSGVFSLGGAFTGVGSGLAQRSGYTGSFFTGVLATVVATPCTAPFMGAALGFALTQPPAILLAVFLGLGLGLALPYLLLCYWPSLQRCLPKPGVWMDRLKQFLAFPMYGAAVWLVWVLAQQAGVNAAAVALGGMIAIAFAAWLYEISKTHGTQVRYPCMGFVALALVAAVLGGYFGIQAPLSAITAKNANTQDKRWETYSTGRLQQLRAQGKPVFVNFTAAWCISCLVNEQVALSQTSVKNAFETFGITYLKGDWTNRDQEITGVLAEFGRGGVPLYLYYPAGTSAYPVVLPQILTPEIVIESIRVAASPGSAVSQ